MIADKPHPSDEENSLMKSIPTTYNGIIFRSRMEARWAVFMNALSVAFDYEPEGYDLNGVFYLPDFWLPDLNIFMEIKPLVPTEDEMEKARRLVQHTGCDLVFQVGNPRFRDSADGAGFPMILTQDGGLDISYLWCECPNCDRIGIQFDGRADRIPCRCRKSPHGDKGYNYDSPRLVEAFRVAQGFRFWSPSQLIS
jgi:hypothetical protein